MSIYSPVVTLYDLAPETVMASIDSLLQVIPFSFRRGILWTTITNTFADQGFEAMPQQSIEAYTFDIEQPYLTRNALKAFEAFFAAQFGDSLPFTLTAPDDNTLYSVIFKSTKFSYSAENAGTWTAKLELQTVGDLSNTLNNGSVYPPYIRIGAIPGGTSTSGGGGGTGPVPATGCVRTNLLVEYLFKGRFAVATVPDTSGNNHTATLGGWNASAPTWLTTGLSNSANTSITMPDGSVVDGTSVDWTLEVWLQPLSWSNGGELFCFGWFDTICENSSNSSTFRPTMTTQGYDANGEADIVDASYNGLTWGNWYQIVMTRNGTSGDCHVWINGALTWTGAANLFPAQHQPMGVMTFSDDPSTTADESQARIIGNDTTGHGGLIAVFGEWRMYSVLLTDVQVLQNYNARKSIYGLP